jgi:hypothetical protein
MYFMQTREFSREQADIGVEEIFDQWRIECVYDCNHQPKRGARA